MNSLSDSALMLQVKSGNLEQMGLLYERYKKWLYNFFYQMNKDQNLCEDLVHNVFMRVIKYKHTYSEQHQFVTWLFKIARNENNTYHTRQAKKNRSVSLDEVQERASDLDNADHKMEVKEQINKLNQVIQGLPKDKREIIELSKIKQLKYKEIGRILGCSEEAARTRSHRALHELKSHFLAQQN